MAMGLGGTTQITSSGVIGTSAKPVRVWWVAWLSNSTPSVITMRNGSTSGGTAYITKTGIASDSQVLSFAKGALFPSGLYISMDGNVSSVTVGYENEI